MTVDVKPNLDERCWAVMEVLAGFMWLFAVIRGWYGTENLSHNAIVLWLVFQLMVSRHKIARLERLTGNR